VKDQRLALELSSTKRERDFYLRQVDTAKGLSAMAEKRERRAAAAAAAAAAGGEGAEEAAAAAAAAQPAKAPRPPRTFRQRGVRAPPTAPRVSRALLGSVFGKGSGDAEGGAE